MIQIPSPSYVTVKPYVSVEPSNNFVRPIQVPDVVPIDSDQQNDLNKPLDEYINENQQDKYTTKGFPIDNQVQNEKVPNPPIYQNSHHFQHNKNENNDRVMDALINAISSMNKLHKSR